MVGGRKPVGNQLILQFLKGTHTCFSLVFPSCEAQRMLQGQIQLYKPEPFPKIQPKYPLPPGMEQQQVWGR